MRQGGICAAACTYALDHHVDRLAEDHANARALARGLSQIQGIEVQEPETNLVFFRPDGAGLTATDMVAALNKRGVQIADYLKFLALRDEIELDWGMRSELAVVMNMTSERSKSTSM